MTRTLTVGAIVTALVVMLGACKKEEAKPAAKKTDTKADPKKQPDPKQPEPAKAKTGDELAKMYQDCWAAFSAKDAAKMAACYTDDAVSQHVDTGMPPAAGKEAIAKVQQTYWTAFPDLTAELQLVLVSGKNVVGVGRLAGTHTGPLASPMGEIAATGKKVGYLVFHMVEEADDGRATKEWVVADMGTMMGQLGLNPMPHRAVVEAGAGVPPVVATGSETETKNLELVKAGQALLNKHDVAGLLAMFADDAVQHDMGMPGDLVGKKAIEGPLKEWMGSMSDLTITPGTMFAAGDYVVTVSTLTGTNDGDMPSMKLKKTGKKVSMTGAEIFRIKDGKVAEQWIFYNGMAIAMQLGLLPPPGGAPPAGKKGAEQPADKPAEKGGGKE